MNTTSTLLKAENGRNPPAILVADFSASMAILICCTLIKSEISSRTEKKKCYVKGYVNPISSLCVHETSVVLLVKSLNVIEL